MRRNIGVGDIVGRKSYGKDIWFRVVEIDPETQMVILKGLDWRLIVDAPLEDLDLIDDEEVERCRWQEAEQHDRVLTKIYQSRQNRHEQKNREPSSQQFFEIPGRVFHLDGDANYLKMCLKYYEKLGIPAAGLHMPEKEMPQKVVSLLRQYPADILVITGHDAFKAKTKNPADLANYRNSAYFIEAVENVRMQFERDRDNLIIFAGACQSYFPGIMRAGANFASSPERVNIHALDPVYVVEKIASTPIRETGSLLDTVEHTKSKMAGIGGMDSFGTFRLGFPVIHSSQS